MPLAAAAVAGEADPPTGRVGRTYVRDWLLKGEVDPGLRAQILQHQAASAAQKAGHAPDSAEKQLRLALERLRRVATEKAPDTETLQGALEAVEAADLLVSLRFAAVRERILEADIGSRALERLDAAASRHDEASQAWREAISSVRRQLEPSKAQVPDLRTLSQALGEAPMRALQELRADPLPYRPATLAPRPPVLTPAIEAAYQRANDVQPEPADYASSVDAPLDAEILHKAESLGYDYVQIYEFVRNQIETEVYAGAMKGALGTLRSGRGNDVDQANLLIALLRASRAAARYVHGVIELDLAAAGRPWGLEETDGVLAALTRSGIPHEPVIRGGAVAAVRMEHTWVEAHLPYTNYRGAVVDFTGRTWIPLAPSLKALEGREASGVLGAMEAEGTFTADTFLDQHLASAQSATPLAQLRGRVEEFLANSGGGAYAAQLAERSIVEETFGILPSSMPADVVVVTGEWAELPASMRWTVRLKAYPGPDSTSAPVFDQALSLGEAAGSRLTWSYQPATVEDQRTVLFFGGLGSVPAYLVEVRPVLKSNGRTIAVGEALAMAHLHLLELEFAGPSGSATIQRQEISGNLSAFAIGAPRLWDVEVAENDLANTEQLAAALLAGIARGYGQRWDAAETELSDLAGVAIARPWPSLAISANALEIETLNDVPATLDWRGVNLDAALRTSDGIARAGTTLPEAERAWRRLAGLEGSALEHVIFEDEFLVESISADKGFGLAGDQGLEILSAVGADLSTLLPQLEHPPEVLAALGRWAGEGRRLEIPKRPVTLNAWTGSVWRVEDLGSGAAAYVLSGSINGGATSEEPGTWVLDFLEDALSGPFSSLPNQDPLAGVEIVALPEGDRQEGEVGKKLENELTVRITDSAGRPVEGAVVHFVSDAGGGTLITFEEDPITGVPVEVRSDSELTVRTNALGLASVELELSTNTGNNTIYAFKDPSDEHETRVGLHLIDAWIDSHQGPLTLSNYLSALAFPGEPDFLAPLDGFGQVLQFFLPDTMVDKLAMGVYDEHGNPISNELVTFTLTGEDDGDFGCSSRPHETGAVVDLETCNVPNPRLEDCGEMSVEAVSTRFGASAGVITGTGAGIAYLVEASVAGIDPYIRAYIVIEGIFSCTPQPRNRVSIGEVVITPQGMNSSATGLNKPYLPPITAEFLEWNYGEGEGGFWEPADMQEVSAEMTGGGTVSPLGQVSQVEWRGFATVGSDPTINRVEVTGIPVFNPDVPLNGFIEIYAVEPRILETFPNPLELSNEDRSLTDLYISFDARPEDYTALTREILLMRGDEIVTVIPITGTTGPGEVGLGKGVLLDREARYDLQLVVNRGTEIEARSEFFRLELDQQIVRSADVSISVSKEVDLPNGLQCEVPDIYNFALNRQATVDLELRRIEGMDPDGSSELGAPFKLVNGQTYAEGEHSVEIFTEDVPPGDYRLTLTVRDGEQVEIREGQALSQFTSRDALPVGQSLIQGVNPWNGGLTLSRTDILVPGRGIPLNFNRTYSSNGGKTTNGLGPGWSHSYESKVIITPCGEAIVVGGEGSGMRFVSDGAGGFSPLRGYHGSLIANEEDGSFDFYTIAGNRYHYAFAGSREWLLKEISDPNGNTTALEYGSGATGLHVLAVTDSSGRQLAFRYEYREFPLFKDDMLIEVAGPDGLRIRFTYDEQGNLAQAAREENAAVEGYSYELVPGLDHELRSILNVARDELSLAETRYTYSSTEIGFEEGSYQGTLVIGVQQPEGGVTFFDYDEDSLAQRANSSITAVTDRVGEVMVLQFDNYGSPTSIEDALSNTSFMEWDLLRVKMLSRKDALGETTNFEYDQHGNVTLEEVAGYSKSRTYEPPNFFDPPYIKNRVGTSVDRNDKTTQFGYDSRGNLTSESIRVEDAEGVPSTITRTHTYAPNGDRLTTTSPRGLVTHFEYDDYGNLIRITDPQGLEIFKEFDLRGRLVRQVDANDHATIMGYDTLGRLTSTLFPNGDSRTVVFDDVARTRTESDANDNSTILEYDLEGRVTKITNGEGGMMDYAYDEEGRKIRESTWYDAGTPRFEFVYDYDEAGRLRHRLEPLGRETLYELDAVGNVLTETLRGPGILPRVTTTTYDELYRPMTVSRNLDDRTVTTTFTYDGEGNRLTQEDALDRVTTFEYDALNRVIRTTAPEGLVRERFFDGNGNLIRDKTANDGEDQERVYVYDDSDRLAEQIDATDGRRTFQYDAAGNLTLEVDPEGNTTIRAYDKRNRLTSRTEVTAALGNIVTSYRYDGNGNLVGETWPNGNELTHTYDGLNRLTRSVDSLGPLSEYDYDARSNRLRQQDANGHDTFMTYDALDRLRMLQAPENRELTLEYDIAGNLTQVIDAMDRATTLEYDTLDRLLQVTDPAPFSFTSHFAYDDVGNVTHRTNKRGFTTSFEYDDLDRLTRVTDPPTAEGTTVTERVYDIVGNLTQESDRRGLVTTFKYDRENRRLETTRDGVLLEKLTYDRSGRVNTATDANSNVTTLIYDERNLLTERRAPLGATSFIEYDVMGNRSRAIDPEGRQVSFTYDLRRRPETEARNAGTEITTYQFDGNGNRTYVKRPEGGEWRWEFDDANRLSAVVNAEMGRTEFTYDTTDNLRSFLDGENRSTTFEYDELDRLIRKIYPGGIFEEYGFDENNNLTSLLDGKGQLFAYDYDAKDRQTVRTYPDDPSVTDQLESIAFAYDANNNLLEAVELLSQSGSLATTRTYDTFDRLQSVTDRWGHKLSYSYDLNGNRTQLIDPDNQVTTYAYDALNRMESVSVVGAGVTTYSYLKNGLLEEILYPNGTSATFTHDLANRVETIINRHDAAQVSSFEYTYDLNGNRVQQVENQFGLGFETTSYTYDLADRLMSVTYPEKITSYTYDEVGNRKTEQDHATADGTVLQSKTYNYDDRDQLTQVLDHLEPSKTAIYGYDANGNQISRQIGTDPVTDFVFDVRDQLVRVEDDGSPVGSYRYDYQGLRVQKNVGAGESRYVYDDQSVLVRYGPDSNSKYEYGPDRLLSVNDSTDGRAYYLLDGLGSVTNLISEAGTQLAQYRWDAWGNIREQTDHGANPFGYTGHEMDDESGLIYMKARFYDPITGRFLSHDPLEGDPTNPPSLHRYLYAFQNPTVYTDPTGLMPEEAQEEENKGVLSGAREFFGNLFGADKNRETAERVEKEVGGLAGAAAAAVLGVASAVGEAVDTGLAALETAQEVVAAGLGDVEAAERLDRKLQVASNTIQAIAEDPIGVGAAVVDAVVDTAKGVASGDAGAIHDASSAIFSALAGGAVGAAGTGARAAGAAGKAAQAVRQGAAKAVQAAQTGGRATKAALKQVGDTVQGAVKRVREANLTQKASAGLSRAGQAINNRLKTGGRKPTSKQCFVAGTLIWTATAGAAAGLVPIEQIQIGDEVVSRNPITGETSTNRVVQLFVTENKPILEVEVENAQGEIEVFETTEEHPFFVEGNREVLAKDLKPGDALAPTANGETGLTVRQVRGSPKRATVYNFEVENDHTYFVGETGIWVHNDCDDPFDGLTDAEIDNAFDNANSSVFVRAPASTDRSSFFRVEGGESRDRIQIGDSGEVDISRPRGRKRKGVTLFGSLDDPARVANLAARSSRAGAVIKVFDVPKDFADRVRRTAVSEHLPGRRQTHPSTPFRVDPRFGENNFGFPEEFLDELQDAIIEGSGRAIPFN